MPDTNHCKNCEASFDESFAYCPHCGQEAADRLTFGVLFSNTISNYFSVDARFFRSFIPLMLKPGILARKFVDGKRLSFLHPAQFYLFISVIFFFLFSFSVRDADKNLSESLAKGFDTEEPTVEEKQEQSRQDSIAKMLAVKALKDNQKFTGMSDEKLKELDSIITNDESSGTNVHFDFDRSRLDSLISTGASKEEKLLAMGMEADATGFSRRFYEKMLKFYEQKGGGILQAIYDTIPIAMFLILPLFAFLMKIFYWKRATFAHHMVFSFYFFTFLFTTFSVILIAELWLFEIPGWIHAIIYLSFLIYLLIAMRNFYKSSWFGAIVRTGAISFILMIVVPFVAIGIMMAGFLLY